MFLQLSILAFEAFLGVLWIYCIYAVLDPERIVKFTLERSERTMKFYGFNATIKATKKSKDIIFKGHLVALVILSFYLFLVIVYIR